MEERRGTGLLFTGKKKWAARRRRGRGKKIPAGKEKRKDSGLFRS